MGPGPGPLRAVLVLVAAVVVVVVGPAAPQPVADGAQDHGRAARPLPLPVQLGGPVAPLPRDGDGSPGLAPGWITLGRPALVRGTEATPSVRYSHCALPAGDGSGGMLVLHGYYHDHERSSPEWLPDAWVLHPDTQAAVLPVRQFWAWELLHRGGGGPTARMAHSCVGVTATDGGRSAVVYGGSQGGGMVPAGHYVGHTFADVWRFDVASRSWSLLRAGAAPGPTAPPSREQHSAVVLGSDMLVYGGIDRADMWALSLEERAWWPVEQLGAVMPGQRYGHVATVALFGDGLYLHGGSSRFPVVVHSALWFCRYTRATAGQGRQCHWERLTTTGQGPGPVSNHAAVRVPGTAVWVMYGGAYQHQCSDQTHALDLGTREWRHLSLTHPPTARYKHSMVFLPATPTDSDTSTGASPLVVRGRLVVFGGESMKPYMYHNSASGLDIQVRRSGEVHEVPAFLLPPSVARPWGLGLWTALLAAGVCICLLLCCSRRLQRGLAAVWLRFRKHS